MSIFSPPKVQAPTPTPVRPPPERSSEEVQRAAAEQRNRLAGQGGRANTVFTGGLGVQSPDYVASGTKLLGGGS